MSEPGDYNKSTSWNTDHDFASAKRSYANHRQRSQTETAKGINVDVEELVPESVFMENRKNTIFISDLTGSMDDWPDAFASKFPYVDHEARVTYFQEDAGYLFIAFTDADGDKYPLQVTQPCTGDSITDRLTKFKFEAKCGGGNKKESSELAALYCLKKVSTPNQVGKLIIIFYTDEAPYETVFKDWAGKYAKTNLLQDIDTAEIFAQLKRHAAVYLVKKPYGCSSFPNMTAEDREIYEKWVSLLGEDHICLLEDRDRVVDVTFAIWAKETGKIDYCIQEFIERQSKDPDYEKKKRIFDYATRFIFAEHFEKQKEVAKRKATPRKMESLFEEGEEDDKS